jgi:hypothetical protein
LQIFLTIVRRRSFAQAAIGMGLTTSALTRAIQKLEGNLGVRLLHRTNRTVALRASACRGVVFRLAESWVLRRVSDAANPRRVRGAFFCVVDRIESGRFEDANRLFSSPERYDIRVGGSRRGSRHLLVPGGFASKAPPPTEQLATSAPSSLREAAI